MSKKIDAVYNDDPSAGNDPSTNYKFPSTDGTTNAVALDMDQVAAAVAVRIGASPPPNETENLAQLVITIQDNTLVPNVQPITGVDYTHYNVVTDSDTVPTYPTGFSEGPLPPLLPALAGWSSETKYVYLYDLPTTTQKTLTAPDGTQGVVVTPNATELPSPVTDFTIDSTTATSLTGTFSSTTIIDGVDLRYDIIDANSGLLVNSTGADVSSPFTVTGLTPGAYSVALKVYPESNPSRAWTSDPISGTTATTLTFTAFAISQDGTTTDVVIDTITQSGGDRFNYNLTGEPIAPTDAGWTTMPVATDTLDFSSYGYGDYVVYAAIQLSTDPTNIVYYQGVSVSLVAAAGNNDIFAIDVANTDTSITEIGAPTGTITVIRSNPTASAVTVRLVSTDGTEADAAIAGTNYKSIDTVVSMGVGVSSVEVDYDVLYTNIGHDNQVPRVKRFTVQLSDESTGSINTENGSAEIQIQGSTGYIGSTNAVDVNAPPTSLTKLNGTQVITTNNLTLDGVEIDAQGADHAIELANGVTNFTLTRFVIKNVGKTAIEFKGWVSPVTITNGVIKDYAMAWKDVPLGWRGAAAITAYPLYYTSDATNPGTGLSDLVVRGVRGKAHSCFLRVLYSRGSTGIICENNHFINTTNEDLGMTRTEFKTLYKPPELTIGGPLDGQLCQIYKNYGGQHSVRDNVYSSKRFGALGGHALDILNFGERAGNSEAARSYVEGNLIWGGSDDHAGSGTGFITDGFIFEGGYITLQHNVFLETQNVGISVYGPLTKEVVAQKNWVFCGPDSLEVHENGQGLNAPNLVAANNVKFTDNNLMWYAYTRSTDTSRLALQYLPTGDPPTGWTSQNIMDGTNGNEDWRANGETYVKGIKAILNNPGIGDGFKVKCASADCNIGNGVLRWSDSGDGGSDQLFFTAYGDSEGAGVPVTLTADSDTRVGDWQQQYVVKSANTSSWILVIVNQPLVSALNASETYLVKVTGFSVWGDVTIQAYNQTTNDYKPGVWSGTETITIGGTTKPNVPTALDAANGASAGEVDLTWDDMSYPAYRVYRDDVLIATPATNSYTDTGRTNGVEYSYQVASLSADSPPVPSDLSAPVNFTPSTALPNQLEDLDNDTNWISHQLASVTDNGDSTYTLTNNTSGFQGHRRYNFDGITNANVVAGHRYRITWSHVNGSTKGRIAIDEGVSSYAWTGNLIGTDQDHATLTEVSVTVTPSVNTMQIVLWNYSSIASSTGIWTTPTVEDLDA